MQHPHRWNGAVQDLSHLGRWFSLNGRSSGFCWQESTENGCVQGCANWRQVLLVEPCRVDQALDRAYLTYILTRSVLPLELRILGANTRCSAIDTNGLILLLLKSAAKLTSMEGGPRPWGRYPSDVKRILYPLAWHPITRASSSMSIIVSSFFFVGSCLSGRLFWCLSVTVQLISWFWRNCSSKQYYFQHLPMLLANMDY